MALRSLPRVLSGLVAGGILTLAHASAAQVAAGLVSAQQVLSTGTGGFTGTLDDHDAMGSAAAALGDLDGDGVPDLVLGAPGDDDGGSKRGAAWVLFLDAGGNVKSQLEIVESTADLAGQLDDHDAFGAAIAVLGDVDGDGVTDLAVGAPGDDDGGEQRGAVWVLFLEADGSVKAQHKISDTVGGFGGGLDDNDGFGSAVAALGDLDGDGVRDVAVGAPGHDAGGSKHGAVWQLFLAVDGSVKSRLELSDTAGGFAGELGNGAGFGSALAALGDLDGNGSSELAVGAPGTVNQGEAAGQAGVVWVLFLAADGSVLSQREIGDPEDGVSSDSGASDGFGAAVAALGDLDDDGTFDLAVGAPYDAGAGSKRGALWTLFLSEDGSVKSQAKIGDAMGGLDGVLDNGDRFGSSVALLGDLDGDGLSELCVGASGDDDGGSDRGAAWTLFLTSSSEAPFVGTGVNPNLLVPGPTSPEIGAVWDPIILAPTAAGDPLINFLGVSTNRSGEFGGIAGVAADPFGELLISLAPEDLVACVLAAQGNHFAIPVPDDPTLVGLPLYSQGGILGGPTGLVLTNGLDIVIGL